MSITSGFYNSVNGDRKYDAEQLSSMFDGFISEGVFATCGEAFAITPGTGLRVVMAPGRAWLNHRWVLNDAPLSIDIPANSASVGYKLHAIVLDVDVRDDVRGASAGVVSCNTVFTEWTPPMSDLHVYMYDYIYPSVKHTNERKQYIIAFVLVGPNETSINSSNIFYRVGKKTDYHKYHPNFVTGLVDTITSEVFLNRMESSYAAKLKSNTDEFNAWMATLKATLATNVATSLTSRVVALESSMADYPTTAEMHRNVFRGKYLGNGVTDIQLAHIKDGTFEDLYVGDYWTINGFEWVVADMDYWYNMGDTTTTKLTKHHLVIVPKKRLFTSRMNSSATSTAAYIGSEMYKTNLERAKTIIAEAFGDIVLTHRNYFANGASNGLTTAGAWYDSSVELMNEYMVYGTVIYSNSKSYYTTESAILDTVDKLQLALFRLAPMHVHADGSYWLRDVASTNGFCCVQHTGLATYSAATTEIGVRPVFAIG